MDLGLNDVKATLSDYFDGIYEGSEDKLRSAFHPSAHIYSATDGSLADLPLDAFVERVVGRDRSTTEGSPRTDRIVSIDFAGSGSALAKVELCIPGTDFVDFLSLMKIDGRWRIIAKTYHANPQG
jgi:4-oxalocrotonate tautomerase